MTVSIGVRFATHGGEAASEHLVGAQTAQREAKAQSGGAIVLHCFERLASGA